MDCIEEWYRQYGLDVFNYLAYRMGTRDVDDLVQETFVKALRGIRHFKGDSSPKTWLLAIARNVASDFCRKKRRWIFDERLTHAPSTEQPIERLIDVMDARHAVYQGLRCLRPNYQEVVILRGILELSVSETAQTLGWTESRVKVTWHRALRQLRGFLERGGIQHVSVQR
ncbi:MAG: RNA polymerase sigma factor [Alicyclobacillus macrosporangiidus]|uniref:RNA polymerase sigma factor n=1 Tax=Alicyclobacillus macrosporangiidus TaxID=392015 RepID=UPI0026EA4423|nr:RNA polymerase sigma factor [Alicyclobacillus macrosporangiidus]MCL6598718.1 RNA polymerase sigma factor [Alicyclobacillus macrosporangiidus]